MEVKNSFTKGKRTAEMRTVEGHHPFYTNNLTTHFFLLNDNEGEKSYNLSIIREIRAQLRVVPAKALDFMGFIQDYAAKNLNTYIRGWDEKESFFELDHSDFRHLPPALVPTPVNKERRPQILQNMSAPLVFNKCKYHGYRVIPDAISLKGAIYVNSHTGKLRVHVHCSGASSDMFNSSQIIVKLGQDAKYIDIGVKIPSIAIEKGYKEKHSSLKHGWGIYTAALPDPLRFCHPKKRNEIYKMMSVQDGIIVLTMDLAVFHWGGDGSEGDENQEGEEENENNGTEEDEEVEE